MKNNGIKKAFNAFTSGILISAFITVPIMNASASSTQSGTIEYFSSINGNNEYHYYNYSTISTGKNINNQTYAVAYTDIHVDDSHSLVIGEVGAYSRLYKTDGVNVTLEKESLVWHYNGSGFTTSYYNYVSQTDVDPSYYYYSKGITQTFTTVVPGGGYYDHHTYRTTNVRDFTY